MLIIDNGYCEECGLELNAGGTECPFCGEWFCKYHASEHESLCSVTVPSETETP